MHTKNLHDVLHVVHLGTGLDERSHGVDRSLHSSGNLVDVLRLDHSLQVILQDLGEVVYRTLVSALEPKSILRRPTLQLRTTEILEDLLPIRGVIISSKVWLELSTKNLKSSTLANTVGSHQTQDLTRTGHGQPMKLETVGRVAVRHLGFKVGGQVDDVNSAKGTFLRADTASDTQPFRNESDLGLRGDFDTELACTDHRTRLLALLPTFL